MERTDQKVENLCWNCRQPGHYAIDCPYPVVNKYRNEEERKVFRERRQEKKKAMLAAETAEIAKSKDTTDSESS